MNPIILSLFKRSHLLLIICLGLLACSDSPTTSADQDPEVPPPAEELVCDNIRIETQSAEPLSVLTIKGIDSSFGTTPVGILESGDNRIPFFLTKDENQDLYEFILPVHPSGNLDGGSSKVSIFSTAGDSQCGGFEIDIAPIQASNGELESLSETVIQGVKSYFYHFGIEPESVLERTPNEVAPHYLPFRTLYHLFDPKGELSLLSLLEGNSSYVDNGSKADEDTRMLIDALLAKSGLKNEMKSFFDQYREKNAMRMTAEQFLADDNQEANKILETVSIAKLSDLMLQANSFAPYGVASGQGGISDYPDIHLALHKATTSIHSALLASFVHENPEYIGLVSGSMAAIESTLRFVFPDLLPTNITRFELFTDIERFNEDSEEEGTWNIQIEASSNGTTVNVNMLSGGLSGLLDHAAMIDLTQEIATNVQAALQNISTSLIGIPSGASTIDFPPVTWQTFVDANDEGADEYIHLNIEHITSWDGEPAIGLNEDNNYLALGEGEANLQVELVNDLFGLSDDFVETRLLSVHPIEIELQPDDVVLYLSDFENEDLKVDIFANVKNAYNEELEWKTEDDGQSFFTYNDELAHHITYYPPESPGTYLLVAESITEAGPRHERTPPRTASARVQVVDEAKKLFIWPDAGCITPDDEITFQAFLGDPASDDTDPTEIPFDKIMWNMKGSGSITHNGTFIADREGIVEITFVYDDEDSEQTYTGSVSFVVLESCGGLSIESDYFDYSTECVAAQFITTIDTGDHVSGIWAGVFGLDLQVTIETDLRDGGQWNRTFTRNGYNKWAITGFTSPNGRQWFNSSGAATLEIQRSKRTVGEGEGKGVIPLYSGSFNIPMEDANDSNITTIFYGEFYDVPYASPGSICIY